MRVAFGIEYDGFAYVGWQRQKSGVGIQSLVEDAISGVANEPIQSVCAGRTDAGVHATSQIIHIDTQSERSPRGWVLGANSKLPDDVNVTWATPVDDEFHARFSATSRTYKFRILNQPVRSALAHRRTWWVHEALDECEMQAAANQLLGRHDFSAYRAAGCQAATPVREIFELFVERNDCLITITVRANAFLQHMVRNIAGTLVAIGRGERSRDWTKSVLDTRDRSAGGIAAPARGLTLVDVEYPEQFGVPPNDRVAEIRL